MTRVRWFFVGMVTVAFAGLVLFGLTRREAPAPAPPDPRLALRVEAYHYCERRLIASLPKTTDLNVRALRRGRRSSTWIGEDTFRVIGYFEGRVFGMDAHGEYQCLIRHRSTTEYELIQLRMHPEPAYPKR